MKSGGAFLKSSFLFVLLTSQLPSQSLAQNTGKITGSIVDKATKSPIAFANVVVQGTTLGVSSKLDGSFSISRVPTGRHAIRASILGYATATADVEIEAGKTTNVALEMEEKPTTSDEVVVMADVPISAASSKMIQAMDFELRPRLSSQDLLRLVPGLFIAQHAGGGKAEQIFLRGFDCDHGTDVNVSVDGIPVNMVSHGHGQGYADLHFVMPEVLQGMEVYKGPYFAQYGDFGTAGTVKFNTLDDIEHNSVSIEGGRFGMVRAVGLARLPLHSDMTSAYVAGEILRNNSYFDQKQHFKRYNLFGKLKTHFDSNQSLTVWGSSFSSDWDASGQIPGRAVASGLISRFGSIDPSEGGETYRHNVNVQYSTIGAASLFSAQTYISRYHFRLFSNFTFYKEDPVNGDEIEQTDDRTIAGGRVEYTMNETFGSPNIATVIGSSVRYDDITNALWHVAQRQRLDGKAQAGIRETNVAFYVQQDYHLSQSVRLQLGLRNDNFVFNVSDKLHAGTSDDITGKVTQTIFSPKANLTISASHQFDIFVNFGTGFHSNDARGILARRSATTLPRAVGAEIGTRYSSARLTATLALWGLDLEHELVYVGDEGTTEESGATRRIGIDASARFQLLDWLWGDLDLALSRGRYKDLPTGQDYVPLAPTLASTGGLSAKLPSGLEANLRYRYLSDRPANEDNSVRARGYTVFDAGMSYTLGAYKLSLIAENLFNVDWNEAQFDTESQLRGESQPVSELHFTPGTPFTVRAKIDLAF